eukprot:TRINITY_DN92_c0_g6_i1.p1 TRINITY_DN92_c0_g6~~TRINITY_DN92_c0_g6_i1.p1  ORF type:complete len:245 (-),score=74.40 TRINITY_DN92_c0_g6_i1:133-825(-)
MAGMAQQKMMQSMANKAIFEAAKQVEDQLDAELNRMDNMGEDDLEKLRAKRLAQMKAKHAATQENLAKGHGSYADIPDEKEFFAQAKRSKHIICHMYCPTTKRCEIVDRHLETLSKQHVEARFMRLNAEKSPFLVDRLGVWMMPTIILMTDNKTVDKIEGFDSLGGTENFSTKAMEWRLAQAKVIQCETTFDPNQDGWEESTPGPTYTKRIGKEERERGRYYDSGSDEDW